MFNLPHLPASRGSHGLDILLSENPVPPGVLKNSRPLDIHKRSDHPEVRIALNTIMEKLQGAGTPRIVAVTKASPKKLRRFREHVAALVLDLFIAWFENGDPDNLKSVLGRPYVAYSRNKNSYRAGSRYAALHLGYEYIVAAVDGLEAAGLIEHHCGFRDRVTGIGRQSRMRATIELMELLLANRIAPSMVTRFHPPVLLRDQAGNDLDISDNLVAAAMTPTIEAINEMLRDADVCLRITREQRIDLAHRCHIDTTRTSVYRVFNGDFDHGGRFYGHWIQNIRREYRRFIELCGQHVVELDFESLHPRMLYAQAGATPPGGDIYSLPNVSTYYRKPIKVLLNTLINARTERAAINSVLYGSNEKDGIAKEYGLSRERVVGMVAGLKTRHHAIADKFGSGAGLKLQNIDSDIARDVMLALWQDGIHTIPLHDSFIVAATNAAKLYGTMRTAARQHFHSDLPVEIKHGKEHLSGPLEEGESA
ncbi:hypothetical protein [Humidesulfovibrio sp.]